MDFVNSIDNGVEVEIEKGGTKKYYVIIPITKSVWYYVKYIKDAVERIVEYGKTYDNYIGRILTNVLASDKTKYRRLSKEEREYWLKKIHSLMEEDT